MPASTIPTFASGFLSIISGNDAYDTNIDSVSATGADGYTNQVTAITAGSFNAWWNNDVLSPRAPVAGVNGNQS